MFLVVISLNVVFHYMHENAVLFLCTDKYRTAQYLRLVQPVDYWVILVSDASISWLRILVTVTCFLMNFNLCLLKNLTKIFIAFITLQYRVGHSRVELGCAAKNNRHPKTTYIPL